MKEGWQTKKLGELLEVQNGYAFSSKDYSESGHFVMRIGNVQNGFISLADPKFIKLPADGSLARFALAEGDILVSLTGNVGRVGVIQKEHLPAALNQRVARISIRRDSPATREYLLFFLFSDSFREELSGAGHGAAQQNVSTKDLVEIAVPVPPLAEQQRIVGVLDEAFAGLATAQAHAAQNLQNARALFESHLQSVFTHRGKGWVEKRLEHQGAAEMKDGWARKPLGELCDILDSQRKPITKRDRTAGEYPYYGATGIVDYVNGYIFDEPLVLVGEDGAKWESGESTAFTIEGKCWVNNHAHVLRPRRKSLVDNWLVYYLKHSDLTEFVSGLTVPKLNQGSLREIPIPVPPLAEQQAIVTQLDALAAETQRLTRLYEQKQAALAALKKSLLHQAFTGAL